MPETPYTKRELDSHFHEVKNTLRRIEIQTTKTNGEVAKLKVWRGYITGALAIISALVIPLVVYIFVTKI